MLFQTNIKITNTNKIWMEKDLLAPGAEGRSIGCQPSNHASQFIWAAESTERVQARPLVQQVWLLVQIRRGHAVKKKIRFRQHHPGNNCGLSFPIVSVSCSTLRSRVIDSIRV
jgi:hypothetical protein